MELLIRELDLLTLLSDRQDLRELRASLLPLQLSMLIMEAHHQQLHQAVDYLEDANANLHDQLEGVRLGRTLAEEDLTKAHEEIRHMAKKLDEYKVVQAKRLEALVLSEGENAAMRRVLVQKGLEPLAIRPEKVSLVDVNMMRDLLHALFTKPSDKLNIIRMVHEMTGLSMTDSKDLVIGSHSEDEDIPIEIIMEEVPVGSSGVPYMTGVQSQQQVQPIVTYEEVGEEDDTWTGDLPPIPDFP